MALTKVRPPVSEISNVANTTTQIDIPTAGADINIDVNGLDVIDLGSTTITIDDLVTLVAKTVTGELINLSTAAGASGQIETNATEMEVGTTSLHPLELMTNSVPGLTIATDGKVSLATVGTATNHLVDKNYVDTLIGGVGGALTETDFGVTQLVTGHLYIPTSTGTDLLINWGETAALQNESTAVTFEEAFPNACFVGFANRKDSDKANEASGRAAGWTTTGMTVVQSGNSSNVPVSWMAIGY